MKSKVWMMFNMRRPWGAYFTRLLILFYLFCTQPDPHLLNYSNTRAQPVYLSRSHSSLCIWITRNRQQTGIHELVPVFLSTRTSVRGSDLCSPTLICELIVIGTKFTTRLEFSAILFVWLRFSLFFLTTWNIYYFMSLQPSSTKKYYR